MADEHKNSFVDDPITPIVCETKFADSPSLSSALFTPLENGRDNHPNFDKNKKQKTGDQNEAVANQPSHLQENAIDRISALPDHLLAEISNFLPTTDAVKTLTLKCFGNLWASSLKSLIFDSRDERFSGDQKNQKFTNFVTGVLNGFGSNQIHKFELKFGSVLYFEYNEEHEEEFSDFFRKVFFKQTTAETVDSWVDWAVKRDVKVLDIGILKPNSPDDINFIYEFPIEDIHSKYLEELRLSKVSIGVRGGKVKADLQNLKFMSLTGVVFGDWSMIRKIIDGCPKMEQLELVDCDGFGIYQIKSRSKNLKSMKVNLGRIIVPRPMKISAPYLVSLNLEGLLGSFELKNVSSLQELNVKCVRMPGRARQLRAHEKFLRSLDKINETRSGCSISLLG